MKIRQLSPSDAASFRELRLQGLEEIPLAFASSLEEEAEWPLSEFEQRITPSSEKATFGAFDGSDLVGVIGLMRETKLKLQHKALIWGVYVASEYRRKNIGSELLAAAVDYAEAMPGLVQVYLGVGAENEPAKRLYELHGFKEYGREPCFMLIDGEPFDEILMIRRLRQ